MSREPNMHEPLGIGFEDALKAIADEQKPAALAWLKSQANPQKALIGVYTMSEFQTVVNNGLLG